MKTEINLNIEEASRVLGHTWPLYAFVASNQLAGLENMPFSQALTEAEALFGADTLPRAELLKEAWAKGEIRKEVLQSVLTEYQISNTPESFIEQLQDAADRPQRTFTAVDRFMTKWLGAFLDEGLAEWDMPYKTEGFYTAWRLLAIYDSDLGTTSLKEIPTTSDEALQEVLASYAADELLDLFKAHLTALPGWTGYILHRSSSDSPWHQEYPITLKDYLAVRLWVCKKLNVPFNAYKIEQQQDQWPRPEYLLLCAWERSWQEQLSSLVSNAASHIEEVEERPDAQMVFCIDTRSEAIRRHIETQGNYETFGYAGFFGIAMDYLSSEDGVVRKSCPPIVPSAYTVTHEPTMGMEADFNAFEHRREQQRFFTYLLKRMKNMLPSAFGFVEGSGVLYGVQMISRTFLSKWNYGRRKVKDNILEGLSAPRLNSSTNEGIAENVPLEEKVKIVKSAFDLMGWDSFAPLVVFVGHGSHSANNPFASSLDCGACAASPGRHNARMLAYLANLPEVRMALQKKFGIEIPASTLFLGAEHNTTTDEIVLFDAGVSSSYHGALASLKADLILAQSTAAASRLGIDHAAVSKAHVKANNWSETRPEWGLARNAGFIVGPRQLTKNLDLDNRCFLHSYDWSKDRDGKALEGIMQGPMVVTQWINNHYYFSAVDNANLGGGNKISHNVTGKFGVVQGNGGDLKRGLPLQSLFSNDERAYHQPLRLTVVIQAPIRTVSEILLRNEHLRELLDNEWIYLMVMDPEQGNEVAKYRKALKWEHLSENKQMKEVEKEHEEVLELAY